jgi:recombination protein RecT
MSTVVAERTAAQASPILVLRDRLLTRKAELDHALEGSGITSDRFIRTAITAAQTTPELATDVSFNSLWVALLQSCRDQLLPDGVHGAIYPFKREAKWIPMVRGLIDRFQRSGEFKWITANFHREDDRAWDVWVDENGQHFLHRPGPGEGKVIETYAAATTQSGGFFVTIVTEPDMIRIKNVSRARSEDAPWQQWPDQMRLKSAIRRLAKILPMPQPLAEFVQGDYDNDGDAPPDDVPSLAPAAPASRPRSAAALLDQFAEAGNEQTQRDAPAQQQTVEQQPAEQRQEQQPKEKEDDTPLVNLATAHQRGKEARASGMKRTAVPPEYRDPSRAREALAWRAGWDGEPLSAGGDDGPARQQ